MTLVWFCGFSQPHYAEIPPPLFQQMRQYLQMLNPKIKRILKKKTYMLFLMHRVYLQHLHG